MLTNTIRVPLLTFKLKQLKKKPSQLESELAIDGIIDFVIHVYLHAKFQFN